jgi:hypothetical protein
MSCTTDVVVDALALRITELEAQLEDAHAAILRHRVALEHGLSVTDAGLLEGVTTEAMEDAAHLIDWNRRYPVGGRHHADKEEAPSS